ncbi:MAG: hypothetical protein WBP85_10475 [Terracidiphilus sp.]
MIHLETIPPTANRFRLRSSFLLLGVAPFAVASLLLAGCRGTHSGSYGFDNGNEYKDASGTVHISKMGGDIDVEDAPEGADLNTMGGSIHLRNVNSVAKARTMGGNVEIGTAGGPVDTTTMGGNIRVLAAGDSVHATTMGGNLNVRLVASGAKARNIDLSTMGGEVELIVPKGFPMDIDIKLAYTRDSWHKPSITEPFGLAHSESSDWDYSHGSPRKYLYARGTVGTGDNHVIINGIGGDVTIVQE